MLFGMPRGWGQSRQSLRRFWHCRIACKVARALCYGKTGTSGTESSEPSAKDAGCGKCDSIGPTAMCDRPRDGTGATAADGCRVLRDFLPTGPTGRQAESDCRCRHPEWRCPQWEGFVAFERIPPTGAFQRWTTVSRRS